MLSITLSLLVLAVLKSQLLAGDGWQYWWTLAGKTALLGAVTFGAGAPVARRGGDALKIADVTGALTFGGSATLETTILPEDVAPLFTYGSLVPPSSWTAPERYAVVNETSANALNLLHVNKFIIIFR